MRHPLLTSVQHLDLTEGGVAARGRLAETLRRLDDAGGAGWSDDRSPFPATASLAVRRSYDPDDVGGDSKGDRLCPLLVQDIQHPYIGSQTA